jgi:hypothetical protein
MITFAEMEELVVEQTRRPEVPAITKSAIRNATLRAHHVDFFPRDLAEYNLPFTVSSTAFYYDFPDIHTQLERLRSIKTIRMLDPVNEIPTEELEFREVDDLYQSDGCRRPSIYTLQGDTLRVYAQRPTGLMAAFYYRNPNVSEAQYSSWIANMYPDDLAMWAASIVFARVGFTEMAQQVVQTNVNPFQALLVSSHLLGNVV